MYRPQRQGYTLVEVIIASAIMITLMVAVIESLVGSQRYAVMAETQDDLTAESDRALDFIAADLATAGWNFPDGAHPTPNGSSYTTKAWDRDVRYFPYVQIQATTATLDTGLGEQFKHTWRPVSTTLLHFDQGIDAMLPGTVNDATTTFGLAQRAQYLASFFARSQELIFTKATTSSWDVNNDKPTEDTESPSLLFPGTRADWSSLLSDATAEETKRARLRILYTSASAPVYSGTDITGFNNRTVYGYLNAPNGVSVGNTLSIPYGVVMESGWMKDIKGDLSAIGVNWQTLDGNAYTTTSQSAANLKEFMYAVVPSRFGLGRLVRARLVKTPTAPALPKYPDVKDFISWDTDRGMQVDKVLSDNVMRIVFDTWRTVDEVETPVASDRVTTLDINNLRVRLYMARRMGKGPLDLISRVSDRVVTMRARNSALDKDFDATESSASYLGLSPIGLTY